MEKFDCLRCGMCCFFGEKNGGRAMGGIIVGINGWCVYHNLNNHKCRIYKNRPSNCRNFINGGRDCIRKREYFNVKEEN